MLLFQPRDHLEGNSNMLESLRPVHLLGPTKLFQAKWCSRTSIVWANVTNTEWPVDQKESCFQTTLLLYLPLLDQSDA